MKIMFDDRLIFDEGGRRMREKFSTKTVDILFVVKRAIWDIREGKIIPAYELLSEMYHSVSEQIREDNEVDDADSN